MTTVFLSGSRKLSRINDTIRARLHNIVKKNMDVFVGDANGADKAMQSYLAEIGYPNVTVFFVGDVCRNNVGNWTTNRVAVDATLRGRHYYSQKDKKMAQIADFGLVLWDGESVGSVENIFELVKNKKKSIVYYRPERIFYKIVNSNDVISLLKKCTPDVFNSLNKKIGFANQLNEIERTKQKNLGFF